MASAPIDARGSAVLLEIGGNQHGARAERGSGLAEAGKEGIEANAVVQGDVVAVSKDQHSGQRLGGDQRVK